MNTYSLRRATFVALIAPMLLALLLISGSGLLSAHRAISILRDHEMEQEALFLQTLSLHEAAEGEQLGIVRSTESFGLRDLQAQGSGFRIWAGNVVMSSAGNLPGAASAPPAAGFADISANGVTWRRYTLRHPGQPLSVEVAEPAEVRMALTWRMASSLVVPMLLLVVAVAVIATLRIMTAIRPLDAISAEIGERDSGDLRPLSGHRIPIEVAPLVAEVNQLMERLGLAIVREREFADNAAHELRTPLAALKARTQLTRRLLADQPEAADALDSLTAAADRSIGVIEQLLALSRLEPGALRFDEVDLSSLVADVARDLAPAALARQQHLEAVIAPGVSVRGNAEALAMMVRNLLDNAIRYSPAGGAVAIALSRQDDGRVLLRISDTGPGIPPEHIERVFDRFARLSHEEEGSGLGLSIVERIVRRHGGEIVLKSPDGGGLTCEVRL